MSKLFIASLFLIPAIFFFIKWAYKYNNPFKLFFVVGKKGSGKTSYLCKLALYYTRKGWIVYTNVSDLSIPNIRIIQDISVLGELVPECNSVMLLDEVSLIWDNRHYKDFKDSTKEFFRLQRHYKCLVYLFSQTFDVDKKIRDLSDRMYLCTQFLGRWSLLREINKKIIITESTSEAESRISENLSFCGIFSWRFTYIPAYQKYFDSFTLPNRPNLPYIAVHPCDCPDVKKRTERRKDGAVRGDRLVKALSKLFFWFYMFLFKIRSLFCKLKSRLSRRSAAAPADDVSTRVFDSIDDFWSKPKN